MPTHENMAHAYEPRWQRRFAGILRGFAGLNLPVYLLSACGFIWRMHNEWIPPSEFPFSPNPSLLTRPPFEGAGIPLVDAWVGARAWERRLRGQPVLNHRTRGPTPGTLRGRRRLIKYPRLCHKTRRRPSPVGTQASGDPPPRATKHILIPGNPQRKHHSVSGPICPLSSSLGRASAPPPLARARGATMARVAWASRLARHSASWDRRTTHPSVGGENTHTFAQQRV